MTEKVKHVVNEYLKKAENDTSYANDYCSRAFAVLMFALEFLDVDKNLGCWWDDEIHPQFRELGAY